MKQNFKPYPFLVISLSFIFGLVFCALTEMSSFLIPAALTLLFFLGLIVCYLKKLNRCFTICLIFCVFFAGVWRFTIYNSCQVRHKQNWLDLQKQLPRYATYRIKGEIVGEGSSRGNRNYNFLQITKIKLKNKVIFPSIKVQIISPDSMPFLYDDRVVIKGNIRPFGPPRNHGQFDYAQYILRKEQAVGRLFIKKPEQVVSRNEGKGFRRNIYKIRNRLHKEIQSWRKDNYIGKTQAGFLSALLLGKRQDIDEQLKETFKQSGVLHVLVISGLHVGLICGILFVIFGWLPKNYKIVLIMIFLFFYGFLVGFRAATMRAVIMAELFLMAFILKRESYPLNILSIAALVILIFRPFDILDAGFQLSFIAVLSIIFMYRPIYKSSTMITQILVRLFTPLEKKLFLTGQGFRYGGEMAIGKIWNFFCGLISVTLSAQIGLFPIILYYFNIFVPGSVLSNIFVLPLMSIILFLGYTGMVFSLIKIEMISCFIIFFCGVIIKVIIKVLEFMNGLPFFYVELPTPSIGIILGYYLILGVGIYMVYVNSWKSEVSAFGEISSK
jgi:competence protein ComEC